MPNNPNSRNNRGRAAGRGNRARRTVPASQNALGESDAAEGDSQNNAESSNPPPSSNARGVHTARRSGRRWRVHGSRRAAAAAAAAAEPESAEEHYWPTIKEYIRSGGHQSNRPQLKAMCPICMEELPVRGLNPSSALVQQRGGVLTSCGHIFCRDCLTTTYRTQMQTEDYDNIGVRCRRACPVCRKTMECLRCGIQSRLVDIPKDDYTSESSDYVELPLTVPEGGTDGSCLRCQSRDWWMQAVESTRQGTSNPNAGAAVVESFERVIFDILDLLEENEEPTGVSDVEEKLAELLQAEFEALAQEREDNLQRYIIHHVALSNDSWQ